MLSAADASPKPRVIATTDGEVDDRSSMIRFLLYACDFDVAGIVQVNSRFQKDGHSDKKWIEAQLDAYELAWLRCRKIGYIFQTFNIIQVMTALENVTLPMTFAGTGNDETRTGQKAIASALFEYEP